jgi:O-antigen biosynthesis protein
MKKIDLSPHSNRASNKNKAQKSQLPRIESNQGGPLQKAGESRQKLAANELWEMDHISISNPSPSNAATGVSCIPIDERQDSSKHLTRTAALLKLMRLSLSNPIDTIKLINLKFLENVIQFLMNKEENGDRVFNKYQQIYFKSDFKNSVNLHRDAKKLVSLYKLPVERGKGPVAKIKKEELRNWTGNLRRLSNFHPEANCTISIIIPVHNHIRFTLACLHSIFINAGRTDFEIIIADDMSTDETQIAFEAQIKNVRYFRNNANLGFLNNCKAAANHAIGRYLVFLNNDIIVLPGWLNELIKLLEENPSIGLVGSKLIYPDGRLQEAGGIIFNDASGWNYGRFDHPGKPQYNFLRDADYCSGASIAISSELWQRIGGFDTRFSPAYYEDTDLAFQVRKAGKRVVYQPLSEVVHFEGVSHGTSENESVKQHQPKNKLKFLAKWNDELTAYGTCNPSSLPADRASKGRILVIDAVTPTPDKDSGSIDTYNFLKIFKDLGYHVTFIPENLQYCLEYTHTLRRIGVECVHLPWFTHIQKAVEHYAPGASFVFLYRASVAEPLLETVRKTAPKAKIIFDTVDLHFLRKKREAEIVKSHIKQLAAKHMQEIELGIINKVDATILLSAYEMELASQLAPNANLFHIPVVRDIPGPSKTPWEKRRDIVFIGGYQHPPNIDAVLFFVKNVWPHLRATGFSGRFVIAGSQMPDEITALASDEIVVRGYIPDLSELFDSCRLSVVPLRYGAGMKGKVITSLSYGVPCVATSIGVEGTGLVAGKDILVEDDPKQMAELIQKAYDDKSLWEKLSGAGLKYCIENCSIESVKKKLAFMLLAISG